MIFQASQLLQDRRDIMTLGEYLFLKENKEKNNSLATKK